MMKEKFRGKVISIVGSPASGKTFLAKILSRELDAKILFEHPRGGFPKQIKYNLENRVNLMETILWFRNRQINNHVKALELSTQNETVILDTPYYQNQLFIELYIDSPFTRKILYELGAHDLAAYNCSNVTIYISSTPELVRKYLLKRYGERHWEEENWCEFISKMPIHVDNYMSKIRHIHKNVITINRDSFDFARDNDINIFLNMLNGVKL